MQLSVHTTAHESRHGRWVTERVYADQYGLSRQTLTNWRYRDLKAGRTEAAPGFPRYKRFGRAVRYFLPGEGD